MSSDETAASDARERNSAAAKWPYVTGLISIVVGVAGLVLAPISGIVYVSLPGVVFATYHAFACHSPARAALAVAAIVLAVGPVLGAVAVYSLLGDNFFVQEWASMAALFGMPVLGIMVGLPALTVACFRPGSRPAGSPIGEPV